MAANSAESICSALGPVLVSPPGVDSNQSLLPVDQALQLIVTVDTLVRDVHFTLERSPEGVGHKSLAVNLSDLAAMGAEPRWASLVLALPEDLPEGWLQGFVDGFRQLAAREHVQVTAVQVQPGPLSVTVQAWGQLPPGAALLRSGAQPGDLVMVTGTLGDAAAALRFGESAVGSDAAAICRRLDRPEPRIACGVALRGLAHAAIDVSDGLVADLGHILERSGCGACLWPDRLPISPALRRLAGEDVARDCALRGGDDYELCFTVAAAKEDEVRRRIGALGVAVAAVGEIEARPGLRACDTDGVVRALAAPGWDHFAS